MILRGIFHLVSRFPRHFMLNRGNFEFFLDSVFGLETKQIPLHISAPYVTGLVFLDYCRHSKGRGVVGMRRGH